MVINALMKKFDIIYIWQEYSGQFRWPQVQIVMFTSAWSDLALHLHTAAAVVRTILSAVLC